MLRRVSILVAVLGVGCAQPATKAPVPTAAASLPSADTCPLYTYRIETLAPGVYAFVEPDPTTDLVSGNTLVVVGDDGVLVVDTGHFPSLARKMIGDIRKLTDQPVRYVVNTHWHPDHVFGNAAYREAFPNAVFLAHAETRRLVVKNDPQYIEVQQNMDKTLERARALLATGKHRNGAPVTADERVGYEALMRALEATRGDAAVTLSPETMTFESEVDVFLGKREVKVLHLGRGNTAGDAVVYVPDARVVASGDLVVGPTPYAFGSYLGEWIAVLEKLRGLGADTLLPGHGEVQHGFDYVHMLEALFASTRAQVESAVNAGLTLEETRAKVNLDDFRLKIAGTDSNRNLTFREDFVKPGVERAYQEAKGKLEDE